MSEEKTTNLDQVLFEYKSVDGDWLEPAFQLQLTNKNKDQSIWVSVLYFAADFSITDLLLPAQEIPPGGSTSIGFEDEEGFSRTIPLIARRASFSTRYLSN